MTTAPHHFIQNKSIFENYTVGEFEKKPLKKIDDLFFDDDYVILVGGSGLYVNAILKGFDDFLK
jgi:tRNA dimethylallyltransferase